MKTAILFLFLLFSANIFSQAEFKITIDQFKWENPSNKRVDLTIFLTIKNVGYEKGKCEDLYDLYLDCSEPYYYYDIKIKDNGTNILNSINAGSSVKSYITFEVPKDADELTLRFYGGVSRYICESYNKWFENQIVEKFEMFVTEGDLRMAKNNPEGAVTQYNSALEVSIEKYKKDEVRKKLSEAYLKIGDKYYDNQVWGLAIDNYLLALDNDYSVYTKERIAYTYKVVGDDKYKLDLKKEAITFYDKSLIYKEDSQVRKRKNDLLTEVSKKDKKEKKIRNDKIEYQKLLNPNIGFKLGGGISFQNKDGGKEGAPFWSANLSVIPKLYVGQSSHLTIGLNTEFNVCGLVTDNSNKKFRNYYGFKDSIVSTESALSNEYSLNLGIGLGYLSESVTPLLLINFGIYALNIKYNTYDLNTGSNNYSSIDALYWGFGPKIEFSLAFSRKFYLSYSFKSFSIASDNKSFEGRYSGHNINLGFIFF
ncbi:MAG: DUF4352 domain-containing protein [Ignavibacteria bacterium]|nr:DUF4352 domain-containing protein [Ignavibacteria bacterium]